MIPPDISSYTGNGAADGLNQAGGLAELPLWKTMRLPEQNRIKIKIIPFPLFKRQQSSYTYMHRLPPSPKHQMMHLKLLHTPSPSSSFSPSKYTIMFNSVMKPLSKPNCPLFKPSSSLLLRSQPSLHRPAGMDVGKLKQFHNISSANGLVETKPYSLILPRSIESLRGVENEEIIPSPSHEILGPGIILLKNYLSLRDQVGIVNLCQKWGIGRGGFYQPGYRTGAKLKLQMMCFGRNWEPESKYRKRCRSDGSEAPPLPHELVSLTKAAIQDAQAHLGKLPTMCPDICIVNFYETTGRLGLHQDRDESSSSLRRGLPVVSISIGDAAKFLYGPTKEASDLEEVLLESGDVVIFGGESRLIYHGVTKVISGSAPLALLQETMLRPGRLNLTIRQF